MLIANYEITDQRYKDILISLSNAGFDVYTPGMHNGECQKPYIVVLNAGTDEIYGISSTQTIYEILLYVPIKNRTYLDEFADNVKNVMRRDLWPMILPVNSELADYVDDEKKAHMRVLQYKNYRQIIH